MNVKKNIPNVLTCGNLVCGCFALVKVFQDDLIHASYFVGIALIFDFLDGFVARLLKVSSEIGKDLDSLADMVTFGVVPGAMMFKIIGIAYCYNQLIQKEIIVSDNLIYWQQYFGFTITVFSCIRLAIFNSDVRQKESFIGLPTPANSILICSIPLIIDFQPNFIQNITNPLLFIIPLTFLLSFLLVSEISLFALKFKNFTWKENKLRYFFIAISLLLIVLLKFIAIPLIIINYILFSVVNNLFFKKKV